MKTLLTMLVLTLALVEPAAAQTWTTYYISQADPWTHFFPDGSYLVMPTGPIYVHETNWTYVGQYGSVALPVDVALKDGYMIGLEQITGGGGGGGGAAVHVGTPELAIMRRLMPRLPALSLEAKLALRAGMQRATAWGAAGVLKAVTRVPVVLEGTVLRIPGFDLEVEPWCSGVQLLKLLLGLAIAAALLLRPGWGWSLAYLGVACLVALEVNILRVVAVALTYDTLGRAAWGWKETWAAAATAFGILQVGGMGWWSRRWR